MITIMKLWSLYKWGGISSLGKRPLLSQDGFSVPCQVF